MKPIQNEMSLSEYHLLISIFKAQSRIEMCLKHFKSDLQKIEKRSLRKI